MRPRVPQALAALSPRQLGQHVRETGAWMSGRAWAEPLAHWEAAPVVPPEQFYRIECARPVDLMASHDGGEYERVPEEKGPATAEPEAAARVCRSPQPDRSTRPYVDPAFHRGPTDYYMNEPRERDREAGQ